ncbi:MAG: zinc-binding dehydrogenase [Actinomycetes bacterium]
MIAARATSFNPEHPAQGLTVGETPEPVAPDGWVTVTVTAASLNHHDVWSLKGVGLREDQLPITLGTDAAAVDDDGHEYVVHAVIGDPAAGNGDETFDPKRSLLSERYDGTLAQRVTVPARNLVAKPAQLSAAEAACVPTAWLTAYRMLTTRGQVKSGETVLVQGAGGGVSTALVVLGQAMGARVWVTSRDEARREHALALGAEAAFESGARLPERVDAVMESVGEATWAHSLRALRPGGRVVVCGATSGAAPSADLNRVFFLQLSVIGSTMGTRDELEAVLSMMVDTGLRPQIDSTYALSDARSAIEHLASGAAFGKIVVVP